MTCWSPVLRPPLLCIAPTTAFAQGDAPAETSDGDAPAEPAPIITPPRLITFVQDRPGHDFRYAIDAAKIRAELGWRPTVDLEQGLARTVAWYLDNEAWWRGVQSRGVAATRRGLG